MSANGNHDDTTFAGGGECGALMRSLRWEDTELGPPSGWPRTLRTLIPIMLASRFAMRLLWGPNLILLYNDGYLPVLGSRKHPGAMGRPVQEHFHEVWGTVGPLFARVLEGESVALDDGLLPLNRSGYLEECYFTLSYSPIPDDERGGRAIIGVLGVVHETTERVLAERRLVALRQLAATLADAETLEGSCRTAGDALVRHGADVPFALFYAIDEDRRRARLVWAAGLAGRRDVAPEELALDGERDVWPLGRVGEASAPFVATDLLARFGEIHAGPFPEPITSAIVLPLTRPGSKLPSVFIVAGINPRHALDPKYQAFFELAAEHVAKAVFNVVARIEERRNAAALARAAHDEKTALENSHRLKDEFVATMSHELRTPLNAILGWVRMLRMGRVAEPRVPHALATIERNAVAQTSLIDDLLDASRILTGKLRLHVESVDFPRVVEAAVDTLRPAAEARAIVVHAVIDSHAGPVRGDPDRLSQIIANLLSNAVKFSPKGGRVHVHVERVRSMVRVTVRDHGVGIAPEFLPFVFERFRQADQAITRRHGGLGLGLSIVKHLAELHGGTVTAESDGVDRGATFTLTIPLSPVASRAGAPGGAGTLADGPSASRELEGLKVLVVDDELDARDLIAEILANAGVEVRMAANAAEAIRELQEFGPDVLVSDIGMPGTDGFVLIQQIRARPPERGGRVRAVAVTAYARGEDRRRALAVGFDLHMSKPVDPTELIVSVARLAGRYTPVPG